MTIALYSPLGEGNVAISTTTIYKINVQFFIALSNPTTLGEMNPHPLKATVLRRVVCSMHSDPLSTVMGAVSTMGELVLVQALVCSGDTTIHSECSYTSTSWLGIAIYGPNICE